VDLNTAKAEIAANPSNRTRLLNLIRTAIENNEPLATVALLIIAVKLADIEQSLDANQER
jgi:hypothetical protein